MSVSVSKNALAYIDNWPIGLPVQNDTEIIGNWLLKDLKQP